MKSVRRRSLLVGCSAAALALAVGAVRLSAQLPQAVPVAPQPPVEPPPSVDPHRPAHALPAAGPQLLAQAGASWSPPTSAAQFVDRYGNASGASAAANSVPQNAILSSTVAGAPSASMTSSGEPLLRGCIAKLIDRISVSVQEPGIITALEVREGMMVEAEALVGRVSDSQARMAKLVAQAEHKIAQDRAVNDIEIRFAESAAKVAEFEYRAAIQANERSANSISQVKLQELALAYEKAQRQIEQAKHNLEIYKEEAEARRVEVEAAEDGVKRRQITAPIAGEVVEVPVHVGEFVKPGDPIFQVIRLDQLAVEGFLSSADYAPGEVVGKGVTVEAVLAHGRTMQFAGKVVFAHPEIDARRQFRIKAEVTNIAENGHFLLRPGQEVDMLIRRDASPTSTPTPTPTPTLTPAAPTNLAVPPQLPYERR